MSDIKTTDNNTDIKTTDNNTDNETKEFWVKVETKVNNINDLDNNNIQLSIYQSKNDNVPITSNYNTLLNPASKVKAIGGRKSRRKKSKKGGKSRHLRRFGGVKSH